MQAKHVPVLLSSCSTPHSIFQTSDWFNKLSLESDVWDGSEDGGDTELGKGSSEGMHPAQTAKWPSGIANALAIQTGSARDKFRALCIPGKHCSPLNHLSMMLIFFNIKDYKGQRDSAVGGMLTLHVIHQALFLALQMVP